MADSSIEWTDATWNPVVGCTRASAGCDNCYAVKMSRRLELMGQTKYAGLTSVNQRGDRHFNGVVRTCEDDLLLPLRWKKPRKVFVNSMSDLFHKDVPFDFVDKCFAVMALCPQHTFQILTKRPDRMAEYFAPNCRGIQFTDEQSLILDKIFGDAVTSSYDGRIDREVPCVIPGWWDRLNKVEGLGDSAPPNVWLGTSCEDQKTADERIPHLLRVPTAVRFLSCEPLIGPIDLDKAICGDGFDDWWPLHSGTHGNNDSWHGVREVKVGDDSYKNVASGERAIHWVICGGESEPNARPMKPAWAESLRDQCRAAGVPFFFKQWGEWVSEYHPEGNPSKQRTSDAFVQLVDGGTDYIGEYMCKVGKHRAGRVLDGRTWDEFPEVAR